MLLGNKTIGTIAYLGAGAIYEEFFWSLNQMIQYNYEYLCESGERIHYDRVKQSYHSYARNELARRMRGDWLLMLDTDHAFAPDICARMLHLMYKHDVDVIVGKYRYKMPPHAPVLYKRNEDDALEVIVDWDKSLELVQVDSSGGGCLLVKREVYDRIENELHELPFIEINPYSEDHSFFIRLAKLNIKTYCATNINYNHLSVKEITDEDFKMPLGGQITEMITEGILCPQ